MAVTDATVGGTVGIADTNMVVKVIKNRIDFADQAVAAATDTLYSLDLPAGFVMMGGWVDIVEADTGGAYIDSIGYYGGTADAWHSTDIDMGTVARHVFAGTYGAYGYGTNHATADTLDLLFKTAAPTDAVIDVVAYGIFMAQPA